MDFNKFHQIPKIDSINYNDFPIDSLKVSKLVRKYPTTIHFFFWVISYF